MVASPETLKMTVTPSDAEASAVFIQLSDGLYPEPW
jgi:hypothetical protein